MAPSNCPKCGAPAPVGANNCDYCGAAILPAAVSADPPELEGAVTATECPWCQTQVEPDQEKCGECGKVLKEDTTLKQCCTMCGALVSYPEKQIDSLVKCPKCSKPMKLRGKRTLNQDAPKWAGPKSDNPPGESSGGSSVGDILDWF